MNPCESDRVVSPSRDVSNPPHTFGATPLLPTSVHQAAGTGFISAWPERVFDRLEGGHFGEVWAPWYTVHKILAGLLDAHHHLHGESSRKALSVAQSFGVYLARRVSRVIEREGEAWWQATLEVEFGGMAEAAYRLYVLSSNSPTSPERGEVAAHALRLARAFSKREFIEPLERGEDSLGGRHANTHLPLLVSAASAAEVSRLVVIVRMCNRGRG